MRVNVSQTTEKIIQQELAEGAFSLPEEVIDAMAEQWTQNRGQRGAMPVDLDVDVLAEAQSVGPIANCDELFADFWPADEDLDDFLSEVREIRQHGPPPEFP